MITNDYMKGALGVHQREASNPSSLLLVRDEAMQSSRPERRLMPSAILYRTRPIGSGRSGLYRGPQGAYPSHKPLGTPT